MQNDVGTELLPFQKIANTAGFFTVGEFCDLGTHSPLFNTAIVVVGMREGCVKVKQLPTLNNSKDHQEFCIFTDSHTQILLRLQHFMRATTEELETVNHKLTKLP